MYFWLTSHAKYANDCLSIYKLCRCVEYSAIVPTLFKIHNATVSCLMETNIWYKFFVLKYKPLALGNDSTKEICLTTMLCSYQNPIAVRVTRFKIFIDTWLGRQCNRYELFRAFIIFRWISLNWYNSHDREIVIVVVAV